MAENRFTESSKYDPSILHDPVDYPPDGPIAKVIGLLEKTLRLCLKDERQVIGKFTAFDKFGNIVLTEANEIFREKPRKLPMVIVPLDYVVKLELCTDPPTEEQKDE